MSSLGNTTSTAQTKSKNPYDRVTGEVQTIIRDADDIHVAVNRLKEATYGWSLKKEDRMILFSVMESYEIKSEDKLGLQEQVIRRIREIDFK